MAPRQSRSSGRGAVGICPVHPAMNAAENRFRHFSPRCGRGVPRRTIPAFAHEKCGQHHPKPVVPVPVVRIVPVADGATHVVFIVVERATANHPGMPSEPALTVTAITPKAVIYFVIARRVFLRRRDCSFAMTGCYSVALRHPPKSRPISVSILATC